VTGFARITFLNDTAGLYIAMAAGGAPRAAADPPFEGDPLIGTEDLIREKVCQILSNPLLGAEDVVHGKACQILSDLDGTSVPRAVAKRLASAAHHVEVVAAAHRRGENASVEECAVLVSLMAWATSETTLGGIWRDDEPSPEVAMRQVLNALRDFVAVSWTSRRAATQWVPGQFLLKMGEAYMAEDKVAQEISDLSDALLRPFGCHHIAVEALRLAFPLYIAPMWWRNGIPDRDAAVGRVWIAAAATAAMFEAYEAELHSVVGLSARQTQTHTAAAVRAALAGPTDAPPSAAVVGALVMSATAALEKRVLEGRVVEPAHVHVLPFVIMSAARALSRAINIWPDPTAPPRPLEELRARLGAPWVIVHTSIAAYLGLLIRAPPTPSLEAQRRAALRLGIYVGLMLQALPPHEP
jgi:hypothetical protein